MSSADIFFCPPDVMEAQQAWGANSGPASLAAILRRPVMELARFFPNFVANKCIYPVLMMEAITMATKQEPNVTRYKGAGSRGRIFPVKGVACVQFSGPWDSGPHLWPSSEAKLKSRGKKQLKHAHWLASRATSCGVMIYDVTVQQWLVLDEWTDDVLPALLDDHKSSGWWCRMGYEVLS